MQTKIRVLFTLFIFLCFTRVSNAKDGGFGRTLLLAEKSKALYDIVTVGSLSKVEGHAVTDLANYLSRMSGARFQLRGVKGKRAVIYVGSKDQDFFHGTFSHLQVRDSFSIRTLTDTTGITNLYLVGHDSTATAFAVYTFLKDLGCRWMMPGKIGEVVPAASKLEWTFNERTEQPDFPYRQIWWAYGGPEETAELFRIWKLRNKVAFPQINHGHNLTNSLPPEKYWKTHPEYYALVDGKRQTTQICTANPDVIRLVIEHINEYLDENPQVMAYSLCPDDNVDFCECPLCQALDVGGTDKYYTDKPVITDRYIHFLNEVARGIQETHPGKKVSTYAYQNYSKPPIKEKIDPNVVIVLTSSVYCSAHGIGDVHCESRQEMKKDLAGWTEASSEVYIYDYDPVPYNAELPWPLFGARCREMSDYLAMGVKGFSFESHNSWATLAPNFYVSAKMMWDTHLNYDELMTDYVQSYFGNSAKAMADYYRILERSLRDVHAKVEWGQQDFLRIFHSDMLGNCRQALDEAQKKANSGVVKERVNAVSLGLEYLENYIELRQAAFHKFDYDEYKRKRARCVAIIDQLYQQNKDYILHDVALEYLRKGLGEIETSQYTADLGLVTDWMVIGAFDNKGNDGYDRVYPPEKELDYKARYTSTLGKTLKWQEYHNPEWLGNIDLIGLFKQTGWLCAYAATVVESPKKQKVQVRLGSNDSVKMWLNNKLVWTHNLGRVVALDDDVVEVTLPKGKSQILLKICNQGGNWGFCFRMTDEEGNRVKGLKYSPR